MSWVDLAVPLLTLAGVILGFWQQQRKMQEIHVLVNSKLDEALARGVQLTGALDDAGVDVPDPPA